MPTDDESKILPPMMNDRARPQANRTMLGVLLALLAVAVLLALWFLLFDNGDSSSSTASTSARPTPLTIATSTPVPSDTTVGVNTTDTPAEPDPTAIPAVVATPVPEGFEACTSDAAPLTTSSYIVDTNTTPLNQRDEPSVNGAQAGTFDPGETGLVFTGECVVNVADGYTWWKIFNGSQDVWIASAFVTAN